MEEQHLNRWVLGCFLLRYWFSVGYLDDLDGSFSGVLNLNGLSLGLAVQVHLSSSIREHDRLRELSLADTQLTMDSLEAIVGNHQLELLDLGTWAFVLR